MGQLKKTNIYVTGNKPPMENVVFGSPLTVTTEITDSEENQKHTWYKLTTPNLSSGNLTSHRSAKIEFTTTEDNIEVEFKIKAQTNWDGNVTISALDYYNNGGIDADYSIATIYGNLTEKIIKYQVPTKGKHFIQFEYSKGSNNSGDGAYICAWSNLNMPISEVKSVYVENSKIQQMNVQGKNLFEYGKGNIIKWSGKRSIDFNNYIDKDITLGISYSYKDYTTNEYGLNRNGVAYLYDGNVNSCYDLNKLYFWNNPKCKNIRLGFTYDNNFKEGGIYSDITYSIDFSDIDFSRISYIDELFYGWHGLNSIKLPNDFAKGKKSLVKLFCSSNNRYRKDGCNMIKSLDIANCDISDVTDIRRMFMGCAYIDKFDIGKWDTSNVVNMEGTFSQYIEKDSFQTNCAPLKCTIIDVSNWNVSNVTNMACMFKYCSSLTTLDLSRWDVSNVTNMSYIFEGCTELKTLIAGHESNTNVTALNGLKVDIDLSDCTKLNDQSIMAICRGIANLPSDNKKTITLPNKVKDNTLLKLNVELAAENKHWNIAYK